MTACTWDSGQVDAHIVLSGGNLTAAVNDVRTAQGTVGYSDHPRAFEVQYNSNAGAPQDVMMGVGIRPMTWTSSPGSYADSWAWRELDGKVYYNSILTTLGAFPTVGSRIGVVYTPNVDGTNGSLEFFDDGVSVGVYSSPTLHNATVYPVWGCASTSGNAVSGTLVCTGLAHDYGVLEWDEVYVAPPVASFTRSPGAGEKALAVAFTDTSSGTPTAWSWDFGDGNVSSSQNPVHIYEAAGTYTVTLTATNSGGSDDYEFVSCVVVSGVRTNPVFAYQNLLEDDDATVTVSTEDADFPMENAYDWNPTTFWKPTASGASWIRASFSEARAVNYVALYAHDLGTNGGNFKLQYSIDAGANWVDMMIAHAPVGTECIYKRFTQVMAADWRVLFTSTPLSSIGVLSFGVDFELEHGDWVGFSPPNFARDTKVTNVTSERGTLLGRSIISQGSTFKFDPAFMSETFTIDTWLPFVIHAEQKAFFMAWNIDERPSEAAFCWTTQAPGKASYSSLDYLTTSISGQARLE